MEQTVYVRMSAARVAQIIASLPRVVAQRGAVQDAIMTRVGMAALSRIRAAFVTKSRGGTDEAGDRWQPLARSTVAGRRHPGKKKTTSVTRPSSALTAAQRKRWWAVYGRMLAAFKNRASAAKVAWATVKREGATTLLEKYGGERVEILRDTGLLLNSLSPGVSSKEGVRRLGAGGEIIVGTNRKGASAHHRGVPGRLPQRRLWPEPKKWPAAWRQDMLEQLRGGVADLLVEMLRRG